jgi:hypothetical protein
MIFADDTVVPDDYECRPPRRAADLTKFRYFREGHAFADPNAEIYTAFEDAIEPILGYRLDVYAIADLHFQVRHYERHKSALLDLTEEASLVDVVIGVALFGHRRLAIFRHNETGIWFICGDGPADKAEYAHRSESMWVIDQLARKAGEVVNA